MNSLDYRLKDCGEQALSIDFGESVDPEKHARILALEAALRQENLVGLRETAPSYRALIAYYDPLILSREDLAARIEDCARAAYHASYQDIRGAAWLIPCCYDPALAEDINEVAALTGLAPEALSKAHADADYRAYMYGFAPGYCYLGGLPKELAISRRPSPRPPCPENSVLIGGGLGLIATYSMPTGWYVVGRTPERMFALERTLPCFVEAGDNLRFASVSLVEFDALRRRAATGEIVSRKIL